MDTAKIDNKDLVYQEIRSDIRARDDISFKLLGFVPLISAAGIASLPKEKSLSLAYLGLFAAAATLGLFWWELRNIQTCNWLNHCAAQMHERVLSAPYRKLQDLKIGGLRVGKTEAEKLVYVVAILGWLAFGATRFERLDSMEALPYFFFALMVATGAFEGARADLRAHREPSGD